MYRLALATIVVAMILAPPLRYLPYPYDNVAAVAIPADRLALLPGGANGSVIPPRFLGPYAPNQRLKTAVRLLETEVMGSECVAVSAEGDLILMDRQGFVFRATPSKDKQAAGQLAYTTAGPSFYVGPGRPLGFHLSGKWLYFCCSLKGLLR